MNAVEDWRDEQAEQRRKNAGEGHQGGQPTGHASAHAGSQKPDDWTQEQWDHVPDSMKSDVASGNGYVSKESINRYIEQKNRQ